MIASMLLLPLTSASSDFAITVEKVGFNSYNVVYWDNSSQLVKIEEISDGITTNSLLINYTYRTSVNVTSNLTLMMIYNDTIVAQSVLTFTSPAVEMSYVYNVPNFLLEFNFTGFANTLMKIYISSTLYQSGTIFKQNLHYNVTIPYGTDGLGTSNVTVSVIITNSTINVTRNFYINSAPPLSSFFSLSISSLTNSTYLVQYKALNSSYLIIKNSNGLTLSNLSLSGSGIFYYPSSTSPSSAALIYKGVAESVQPFPNITQNVRTVVVYEGLNDRNAMLIVLGSFFGSIIVSLSIVYSVKRVKHKLGTNKSELLYERLEDNPLANVEIRDASLLKYFTQLVKDIEDGRKENKVMLEELRKLKTEIEQLRGRT